MSDSVFKLATENSRIFLRVISSTGGGMLMLERESAEQLLQLLQGETGGAVNCNPNRMEFTVYVSVEIDGSRLLTVIDRAGREESYPVAEGGVMFRAKCAHDGQLFRFITDLSRAISAISD